MFPEAQLETWLRDRYFQAEIDISSSGLAPISFDELEPLAGVTPQIFEGLVFADSPSTGDRRLREAIAVHEGIDDADRIVVTNGSTEAQMLALLSLLGPGDEVVVAEPAYHTLSEIVRSIGCEVRPWWLRSDEGFAPNLDDLRAVVSPATRMVITNFPHNPTSVSLSAEEQLDLLRICQDAGAYLFWDAAFNDLVFDGVPLPCPAALDAECALSFGTLSKSFGLPGLRVGWGVVPRRAVKRMVEVRDYTSIASSPLVERLATLVVENATRVIDYGRSAVVPSREFLREWLDQRTQRVTGHVPPGGVVIFPRIEAIADTTELCGRVLDEHGVLLIPGTAFGYPDRVRLGFGLDRDSLEAGLGALDTVLDEMVGVDAKLAGVPVREVSG